MNWEELETFCLSCNRCNLERTRNNVVFGKGNEKANLLFVGEAPGRQEDEQGVPFVGQAGRLFNKLMDAIAIDRDEYYVTNILKCRPPGNRNPNVDEIKKCLPFLREQFKIMKPKIIVCLGNVASKSLLGDVQSISRIRGVWIEKKGCFFMPTYHPAALLRNKSLKEDMYMDMLMVRKKLDEINKGIING